MYQFSCECLRNCNETFITFSRNMACRFNFFTSTFPASGVTKHRRKLRSLSSIMNNLKFIIHFFPDFSLLANPSFMRAECPAEDMRNFNIHFAALTSHGASHTPFNVKEKFFKFQANLNARLFGILQHFSVSSRVCLRSKIPRIRDI